MSINKYDLSKLQNIKHLPGGIQAACPVCRLAGADKDGNHLSIWNNGVYSCIVHAGDKDHSKQIYKYLYIGEDIDIDEQEEFIYRGAKLKYYPEELISKLIPDYSYWESRNISPSIVSKFDGGLASKSEGGKLQGRYVFAIRNKDRKIVGWAGRLIGYSEFAPKWKILGAKKSFVFPFNKETEDEIRRTKTVILIESIGDCLNLHQNKIINTKVLFGVKPSSQLIGYLIGLGVERIIISTNNDKQSKVGNLAAEKIKNQLSKFFNVKKLHIILPESKDFGEESEDGILSFKKKIDSLAEIENDDGEIEFE